MTLPELLKLAEEKTMVARNALLATGRMTPGIERLIEDALKVYDQIEECMKDKRGKNEKAV